MNSAGDRYVNTIKTQARVLRLQAVDSTKTFGAAAVALHYQPVDSGALPPPRRTFQYLNWAVGKTKEISTHREDD